MPLGHEAEEKLMKHLQTSSAVAVQKNPCLSIEERQLQARYQAQDVIWFDFATLCGSPRSQNDYLELASRFSTFIVSDIPKLTPQMATSARRLTWLIDVAYDYKTTLFLSAAVPARELYVQGLMANEFIRTVSRLTEMCIECS
jgi:cell division protein ZapE